MISLQHKWIYAYRFWTQLIRSKYILLLINTLTSCTHAEATCISSATTKLNNTNEVPTWSTIFLTSTT
jgi:hypothetical protein